jgi:hypothetical protein
MVKLSKWLNNRITGWFALISLVIFLLFTAFVLPSQASDAEIYSGAIGSPDTSLYYSAEQLYKFAESYGPEGRAAYVRARLTFDIVFPLVYTLFLTSAISWLTKNIPLTGRLWQRSNLVPILGMVFDFLENAATATVMARYPNPTPILAALAGFFTVIKWIFVGGSFVILVAAGLLGILRLITKKQS